MDMSDSEMHDRDWSDLRILVRYGPDGPDLRRGPAADPDTAVDSSAVEFFHAVTDVRFDEEPYGTHAASVHLLDDVVVVHVPRGPDRGLVATFEPGASTDRVSALVDRVEEVSG